jgi:SAM-dependent methyltransferase
MCRHVHPLRPEVATGTMRRTCNSCSTLYFAQVLTGSRNLIVCGDTHSFRTLCRTQVTAKDSVVDIGCSTGLACRACVDNGAQVVGVDSSKEALAQAQAALPNVRRASNQDPAHGRCSTASCPMLWRHMHMRANVRCTVLPGACVSALMVSTCSVSTQQVCRFQV